MYEKSRENSNFVVIRPIVLIPQILLRLFQVGKPIDIPTYISTLGGEDLEFGFEVIPLEDNVNVVEVNNPRRSAAPQFPFVAPARVASLTSVVAPATNPLSKQGQATLFAGPPVIPVPVLPPPPRVVIVEEPEPEPVSRLFDTIEIQTIAKVKKYKIDRKLKPNRN